MRTGSSISDQVRARSFVVVDCTIPAEMSVAEWRRRRVVRPTRRRWFGLRVAETPGTAVT
jgi:hypothetical protein